MIWSCAFLHFGNETVCSCTLEVKVTTIGHSKVYWNRSSARKFKLDVKYIREWRKYKEAILKKKTPEVRNNGKRLDEVGRNPKEVTFR